MEQLTARVWRFHDESQSTSYLVVGDERAAMIDCGMGLSPMMPHIRKITNLPIDLLLTHAHPDHYGAAEEFESIWLHEKDIDALPKMEPAFAQMGVAALLLCKVNSFSDGKIFDLGEQTLKAVELPGHTPGSCVFVDTKNCCLFLGDAIGSGDIVLMCLPEASSLSEYRGALEAFEKRYAPWVSYAWHGGHCHQSGMPGAPGYNPLGPQVVRDMIALCVAIYQGRIHGEEIQEIFASGGVAIRAYLGNAGIIYSAE